MDDFTFSAISSLAIVKYAARNCTPSFVEEIQLCANKQGRAIGWNDYPMTSFVFGMYSLHPEQLLLLILVEFGQGTFSTIIDRSSLYRIQIISVFHCCSDLTRSGRGNRLNRNVFLRVLKGSVRWSSLRWQITTVSSERPCNSHSLDNTRGF